MAANSIVKVEDREAQNQKALAKVGEKPMNQTQLKNLERLVSGDFNDLRDAVRADIENRASKRRDAIAKKYGDDKALGKATESLIALQRKHEDEGRALLAKLADKGVQPATAGGQYRDGHHSMTYSVRIPALTLAGKDEALAKVTNAAARLRDIATRVLNREERNIQRQVLLQGITASGAFDLINDMPKPEDIITLVQQELQIVGGDDVEILLAD